MWWLYPGSVVVVVVGVLVYAAWQRRCASDSGDPLVLRKPVERFGKLPAPEVEALRARAAARRTVAAARYGQARKMQTGEGAPARSALRMLQKQKAD